MEAIILDVSALPAPEPFDEIMQALVKVDKNHYLRVSHRKQPQLLYEPLVENNYKYHVQQGTVEAFDIFIWHKSSETPDDLVYPALAESR